MPKAPGAVPHHSDKWPRRQLRIVVGDSQYCTAEAAEKFVPCTIPLHSPFSASRTRREPFLARFYLCDPEYSLVALGPPPSLSGPLYLGHANDVWTGDWLKMGMLPTE